MKKLVAIIVLICVSITVISSCQDDYYTFSETQDFSQYAPSFAFFPESIGENEVLFFGDMSCSYWTNDADEILVLKFKSADAFRGEIKRLNDLKTKYEHIEKENYIINGYDCIFFMCSFSTDREEGVEKYINAYVHDTFYGISWDLVMVSESEMTIVYNLLRYDTRNFIKWGERDAYITEYFGFNLEEFARNLSK